MRNEYRIRTLKDHPGYVFVEVRYWWFPIIWETVSAHGDWRGDQQMQSARDSALSHAKLEGESIKTRTLEYLGRLP